MRKREKVRRRQAARAAAALNKQGSQYGRRFLRMDKNVTPDNGAECEGCAGMERPDGGEGRKVDEGGSMQTQVHMGRETHENANKMIRRFQPKGTGLWKAAASNLRVEVRDRSSPRGIAGFATANGRFAAYLAA